MKKVLMLGLLIAMAMPGAAGAAVEAGAGNITLMGHIDFVGRYSADDKGDYGAEPDVEWPGYETYNVEFAIIGVAGQLGDNVTWILTEALAFQGVQGSALSAYPMGSNNAVGAFLLDAIINIHLNDSMVLSAGRFIPPTSMTWAPHQMKNLHTVNYPLLNGGGLNGGFLVPLPMYQTGVMLTVAMGPLSVKVGNFNGSDIVGGAETGGINILGLSNIMDIDKTKGTAVKLALDTEGVHLGGWYYGETASVKLPVIRMEGGPPAPVTYMRTSDAEIAQWGLELGLSNDTLLFQAQYLSSTLDFLDTGVDDLVQDGWYALLGLKVGEVMIIGRYDYVDYDDNEIIVSDDQDEESAFTAGINMMLNENVCMGLNYTWRDIEDWDANTDELSLILEVDLF